MQDNPMLLDFKPSNLSSFFQVAWRSFKTPRAYFAELVNARSLTPPILFLCLTHIFPCLVNLLHPNAQPLPAVALAGATFTLGHLLLALALFAVARVVMKSTLTLASALRVVAYGGGVWVFSFVAMFLPEIPAAVYLGLAFCIHAHLVLVGLQSAGGMSMPLAAACIIITAVFLGVSLTFLGALGA